MFFKIINLFIFVLASFSFTIQSKVDSDKISNFAAYEKDNSGLYDQDILKLYNSTKNIEELYLKDNFQTYYFSNLDNNIGDNTKGSCGFIAIGMIISFYDTYRDDNIIPEIYDNSVELYSESILQSTHSPGIVKEPKNIANSNQQTYYSNIHINADNYFHFKLMDLFKNNFSDFPYDSDKQTYSYGLGYNDYYDLFDFYFSNYLELSNNDFIIHKTTESVKSKAIKLVKRGIPVRLSIRDKEKIHENHCVVAYDYDQASDSLFCNFGWGSNSTHVTIEQMEYEGYASLTAIELKNNHKHSNNYYFQGENEEKVLKCACSTLIPTEISISNNYLDIVPTFEWNSLIKEKWSTKDKLHHKIKILAINKQTAFEINDVYDNKLTFTSEQWAKTINNVANPNYYFFITVDSDTYPYWDDYYCMKLFREPNQYFLKSSFLPQDRNIEGRYYFSNELDDSNVASNPHRMYSTATKNNLTINTKRLRCGYIESSYIVLSPRRKNAGSSYFEMNFNKPVYSFMYRACMRSASENLDGIAIIQTKDASANWTTLKDIPIDSLKIKRNGLTQFIESTPSGIYGLRFETTATAIGDRNKGRFCLGDVVFSTSTPNALSYVNYDYMI